MEINNKGYGAEIVRIASSQTLAEYFAELVRAEARSIPGTLNLALPGGRSVLPLLDGLELLTNEVLSRLRFYLIDERADTERNSDSILAHLSPMLGSRLARSQFRFPEFSGDLDADREAYENQLEHFHIVASGSGEDGHFASLFPGRGSKSSDRDVEIVLDSPKPPPRRLTLSFAGLERLSPDALHLALFIGEGKRSAYERFLAQEEIETLPISFLKRFPRLKVITDLA